MMLYGAAFSEEKLIKIAYAFEQLTNVRQQYLPVTLPSTDLIDVVSQGSNLRGDSKLLGTKFGMYFSGASEGPKSS